MKAKETVSLERGWVLLLKDLNIDPENVLRRAQLPVAILAEENIRLSTDEYFRFWRGLEQEAQDPALPILLGQAVPLEAFHPAIFAAMCSSNLKIAVTRISKYKRLVAPMRVLTEDRRDGFFVCPRWDAPDPRLPVSLAITELTFLMQLARIGTREPIQPVKVELPYEFGPRQAFEDFFGVCPSVGDDLGITFRHVDAERPFLTARESMWETFEPELRRRLTKLEADVSIAERVRSALLEGLPSGEASIEVTARRLGISPRTLQRRLRLEGTSYKETVRRTRRQLAEYYIGKTELAYVEISFLLGYEEPSSFFRAFREWTGETPEAVRRKSGKD